MFKTAYQMIEDNKQVESKLIQQIKSAYPTKLNKRYQVLRAKLDQEQLSKKE